MANKKPMSIPDKARKANRAIHKMAGGQIGIDHPEFRQAMKYLEEVIALARKKETNTKVGHKEERDFSSYKLDECHTWLEVYLKEIENTLNLGDALLNWDRIDDSLDAEQLRVDWEQTQKVLTRDALDKARLCLRLRERAEELSEAKR
jgi:hypothetical protein